MASVMIVDDQDGIRRLLGRILRHLGHTVVDFEDGEQGLFYARSEPDLALAMIDLTMPGMDGLSLTRALRAQCPALPVVLMSGFDMDDLMRSGTDLDPKPAFLEKPFSIDTVKAAIDRALSKDES